MRYIGNQPIVDKHIKLADISASFNGSCTTFALVSSASNEVFTIPSADSLIISLGGIVQEPDEAYTISGGNIVFAEAPVANTDFYGMATLG